MFDAQAIRAYMAQDHAPYGLQDGSAGERAISIYEIHGGLPDAKVTGITAVVLCSECDGTGFVQEDAETAYRCPVCKGTRYAPQAAPKPVLGALTVDDAGWWA